MNIAEGEPLRPPRRFQVVLVGIGVQGSGVADLLCDLGHDLVAVVDVGDKVGRRVSDFTSSVSVPELTIQETLPEALNKLHRVPDIVAITASLPLDALLAMAGLTLDRGINVITLHPDAFAPDSDWAPALHDRAIAGGASFLATGVQDTWWVQLPALVASSTVDLKSVRIISSLSLEQLSPTVGRMLGVGQSPAEFESKAAPALLESPPTLGSPLLESARRMGLASNEIKRELEPVLGEKPYDWPAWGSVIPAGRVVGIRETVSFGTDEGIAFQGIIEVLPISHDETADELHVIGVPEHHLKYQPFDGHAITNVALAARVPDVVRAAPGVLFSADLPPASHQRRSW